MYKIYNFTQIYLLPVQNNLFKNFVYLIKQTIDYTQFLSYRKHFIVNLNNIYKYHEKQFILTNVRAWKQTRLLRY